MRGITPAYAGKTLPKPFLDAHCRDHPRLRGKDNRYDVYDDYGMGSPPLTRERQKNIYSDYDEKGITPAYAGKTHGMLVAS